jgi:FkbM family methyltransferase
MNPPGIESLPNGQWIIKDDTHLGFWAKEHGQIITDPHLFKWLKPYVKGCRTVWDIGANIGDHTRQYLNWGMNVLAVEPNPLAYACLEHNCPEANNMNIAASGGDGWLNFESCQNVGASHVSPGGSIKVPCYPMDDFTTAPPDFIKIDIEGWEMQALEGMETTIIAHKPLVLCEINRGALARNDFSPMDVIGWMKARGYSANTFYPPDAAFEDPQYDILFIPL